MFSLVFPSYHPKAGEPTYFVEKIKLGLHKITGSGSKKDEISGTSTYEVSGEEIQIQPKLHTIRRGHRWRSDDIFSPRFWSGPAYRSKQIIFAPELRIHHAWDIIILPAGEVFIEGRLYGFYGSPELEKLAENDGLTSDDFRHWFHHLPFEGQIICWDPGLEY